MKCTYSQIDMDERRKIARWRMGGISVDVIAEKLGRHRSTIFRELRRNAFTDSQMPELNGYYCVTANDMARDRRAKLRKLARLSHLRQSVIERIMHGWSPQQIAGRGMPDGAMAVVSAQTSTFFSTYPDVVAGRKQFGHWECDLMQFRKKFGKANVTTLVERVSRFAVFLRNNDRQSKPVMDGLIQALKSLPHLARRLITFDRGTVFTDLQQASERKHGSAIRRRPGKKVPSKTPTDRPGNGCREKLIRCRSPTAI